jgi:cyclic pyranopterin phosphate synthase
MTEDDFTHLDAQGRARMVDTSEKKATRRRAVARGRIRLEPTTVAQFREGKLAKGDVAAVARVAGIQGAKRCADLIPLCHPLRLDAVTVDIRAAGEDTIEVEVAVVAFDRTGVEMEALTATSAALLTIYDMVKAVDRGAVIDRIELLEKEGGRSGTWRRARGEDEDV